MTTQPDKVSGYCKVEKVDDQLGVVFGWGIICTENGQPHYDLQGDHIPEDVMLRAVIDFAKRGAAADVQHDEQKIGQVVQSFALTSETAAVYGLGSLAKTGWMIGWAPTDKAIVKRFQPGPNGEPPELTGFSIGGTGRRTPRAA